MAVLGYLPKLKRGLGKPQHWHILIIWKRSNKIKAVKAGSTLKVLCHWQSQISELLHSILKITKLLKQIWNMSILTAKKYVYVYGLCLMWYMSMSFVIAKK